MLIYTSEGPRSVDARDVMHVYRDAPDGSLYVTATLRMSNGNELTGRVLITWLDALEAQLDSALPPQAA